MPVVDSVAVLVPNEIGLLRDVIARRRPELLTLVDRIGVSPLSEGDRSALRRTIVDELCEHLLPGTRADRRDLELSDLLLHLGTA
jgi:hypothetical protein